MPGQANLPTQQAQHLRHRRHTDCKRLHPYIPLSVLDQYQNGVRGREMTHTQSSCAAEVQKYHLAIGPASEHAVQIWIAILIRRCPIQLYSQVLPVSPASTYSPGLQTDLEQPDDIGNISSVQKALEAPTPSQGQSRSRPIAEPPCHCNWPLGRQMWP